jgi:8-oxo-dGTP diphosphatase
MASMSQSRRPNRETAEQRVMVAVDVIAFCVRRDELQVLLVQRKHPPFEGMWAAPGGFIRADESLEDAACRELAEETSLSNIYLEQLYTFGDPNRDPRGRVISVAYFALLPTPGVRLQAGSDAARVAWHPVSNLPELAFDHADIINYALTRLRYKLEYSHVGFQLLPEEFTLTELQAAYEIILGESLDKRNFRRKILQAGILEETGQYRSGEGRPAKLYRYREDAETEVKARRLFP